VRDHVSFKGDEATENNEEYVFSRNGPTINASTSQRELPLVMRVQATTSDQQNRVVAHLNGTYDLANGIRLSGSKDVDDPNKITSLDPTITAIPHVAVIALDNSDLVKASYSATPTAQAGMRIRDQTRIETIPPLGKNNKSLASQTLTPQR